MNASFVIPLAREVCPPRFQGARAWQPAPLSGLESLKEGVALLKKMAAESRRLFSKHVYDNPDFNQLDAQQHRARLFEMLWFG
ncbi:MAG TPA: hypothetical protein PKE47_12170, partial [Verrucomicrobiota bacterium]|nr:hypothetical protein [Verrucomicrobiota bacterium]